MQPVQHGQERSDVEPQPTGWGRVIQAKGIMEKQRSWPVQEGCCLNSESKEDVMQAKMGGAGPELGHPTVEFFPHPQCKGKFHGCLKQECWGASHEVTQSNLHS